MFKYLVAAMALLVMVSVGCKSGGSEEAAAEEKEVPEKPKLPVPADSIFAKVKEGMGMSEVYATIGQPTSTHSYMTGKGFIPFHYGGDNSRTVAHYKGVGTLTFSQNHAFTSGMAVMSIDYDPNEPGFEKGQ